MGDRSRVEIMSQILEAVNDGDSYSKSQIMYRAFLNAALTRQYVNTLFDNGSFSQKTAVLFYLLVAKKCYVHYLGFASTPVCCI